MLTNKKWRGYHHTYKLTFVYVMVIPPFLFVEKRKPTLLGPLVELERSESSATESPKRISLLSYRFHLKTEAEPISEMWYLF
jgi:hypothetical protein